MDTLNHTCPRCGGSHPSDVADGLCPRCLMAGLFGLDPPPRSGVSSEQSGDAVGPYELVELLGQGGMGTVWRARQLHPVERDVALKIIKLGMDTREVVSRFDHERRTLAMMEHPNIARVFDAGATVEGRPYFVMEWVRGQAVTDYCRGKSLPLRDRLDLFEQICAAVQHAHQKGIIHRDLKPSNVLVADSDDGRQVKIIDFGIARAVAPEFAGQTFQTRDGQIVGTPGYMSPEQAGGSTDLDTRTDIYSLGALLYELLTDHAPFTADTFRQAGVMEVLRILREEDPLEPSKRVIHRNRAGKTVRTRKIARDLDWIVMKALSRERTRRYPSAAAFSEDVHRFLECEPVLAAAPGLSYRIGKFVRKHRLPVVFFTGIAVSLVVGIAVAAREAGRANRAASAAERSAKLEIAARKEAVVTLADSMRETGLRESRAMKPALAALWFTRAAEVATDDPERRADMIHRAAFHLAAAPVPVRSITYDFLPNGLPWLRFSSGGRHLLESIHPPAHHIMDLDHGEVLAFDPQRTPPVAACFVAGTDLVAISHGDESVEIHDLKDRAVVVKFRIPGEAVRGLWSSGDGRYLLAGSKLPRIWDRGIMEIVSGPLVHPADVVSARFSPDGSRVLTIDANNSVRMFLLPKGEPVQPFAELHHPVFHHADLGIDDPRFVEDGSQFILRSDGDAVIYDSRDGSRVRSLGRAVDLTGDLSFASVHDGIRSVGTDRPMFRKTIGNCRFHPAGDRFYALATGEILDLQGNRLAALILPEAGTNRFSDDGSLLATRCDGGTVVHRLTHREPHLTVADSAAGRAVVSPDSRFFASAGENFCIQEVTTTRVYQTGNGRPAGPRIDCGQPLMAATFLGASGDLVTGTSEDPGRLSRKQTDFSSRSEVRRWDWKTGTPVSGPLAMPSEIRALLPHPDGSWIAGLCAGGQIVRIEADLSSVRVLHSHAPVNIALGGKVNGDLCFSPDGKILYAAGADAFDLAIDSTTGDPIFPPIRHEAGAYRIELRGDLLFTPGPYGFRDWFRDARTGKRVTESKVGFLHAFGSQLADDGKSVLLSGKKQVARIDWRDGSTIAPPFRPDAEGGGMFPVAVTGTDWILTANPAQDGTNKLYLWDRDTGTEVAPPWQLPSGEIRCFTRTPDRERAILQIMGRGFVIVDFARIRELGTWLDNWDPADRSQIASVVSGHRFVNGTTSPFLRAGVWTPEFRKAFSKHPEAFGLSLSAEDAARWHRNRELLDTSSETAAAWHRAQAERWEND